MNFFRVLTLTAGFLLPFQYSYASPAKSPKSEANPSTSTVKPKGQVRVYKGDDGITVSIVELSEPANSALIKVEGTNSDIDDAVLLHQRKEHDGGRRFSYDTKFRGSGFSTVFSESGMWGDQLLLQNPDNVMKKIGLYYDSKASKDAKPETLVNQHNTQAKSGKLSKVQGK